MQQTHDTLTANDVAEILQVSKNTVYSLAKKGVIPSYNVGRKLRFTIDDILEYLDQSKNNTSTSLFNTHDSTPQTRQAASTDDFVISGTDMVFDILSHYLGDLNIHVQRKYQNCYESLVGLYYGTCDAVGICLWDSSSNTYNLPYIKRLVPGIPLMVFHIATLSRGLIVQEGNPKGLRTWVDLLDDGIVLANREKGCSSRVLLDEHLRILEANPSNIDGYSREIRSSLTQGSFIAKKEADVGIGAERIIKQVSGLTYLPLQSEQLMLVIAKRNKSKQAISATINCLQQNTFKEELSSIREYNFTNLGQCVYEV